MTNPTPHGQVPEALIDLIDAYAETRHRCGGIYNAKTEAARKAVIEALSGVQALSAAPAGWKLVPVEPTNGMQIAADTWIAKGFNWPKAIYRAMLAASPTPPALSAAPARPTVEQVEDEVSMGHGAWDMVDPQELIGAVLRLAVSPTPPAEQQACDTPKYCNSVQRCTAQDEARMQATPKAAPGDEGKALAALRYYQHECSGAEPSISVFHRMMEEALEAAPQQEAQEPYAYAVYFPDQPKVELVHDLDELIDDLTNRTHVVTKLYTAPQPAPAPLSEQDERRAFEQDFMRSLPGENIKKKFGHYEDPRTRHRWDGWKARAALAAQGGSNAE